MEEKLYIYYTNDLHSNFKVWPQVATYLKKEKERRVANNDSYWIVDVGDHIDRVHPIAEATMGQANVQLMNEIGYDVITIGNNEGITLPHENLFHLYDQARFKVVCANLNRLKGSHPNWLEATVKIQSVQGAKIGMIGLTVPFNPFYNLLNWHVDYPNETLNKYIKQLKESTDIIILLSHLGLNEDRQIAEKYPDIDVIIGGHTHHLLRTGERVNETLITAAGKDCTFVGEVILSWDHYEKKLINKEAYTINITHLEKDKQTVKLLNDFQKTADQILSEPVVHIDSPLLVNWYEETPIIQKLTQTLKQWTKADVAMLNSGLLLHSFASGAVTYRDVHQICPHPINPCVVQLNGDELLEIVRATYTKAFIETRLTGFGFRGKIIGKMVYSGLDIETDYYDDGSLYVKDVIYQNESINPNKKYMLATADTFTFGRLLPEISKASHKKYFLPEFLRDLLVHTLRSW